MSMTGGIGTAFRPGVENLRRPSGGAIRIGSAEHKALF
jgi:hypothetical protein